MASGASSSTGNGYQQEEQGRNLDQLAESFSSGVINEAISEIVAEEDFKEVGDGKWYRDSKNTTPTKGLVLDMPHTPPTGSQDELSQQSADSAGVSPTSASGVMRDLEKVSPIRTPRGGSDVRPTGSILSRQRADTSEDEPPPTSQVLKDVPGYMSPDSRSKILGGVIVPDKSAHASLSEETFKTQMFEDMQDSMFGDDADRKTSITSSFNSTRGDDTSRTRSYSGRQSETGNSSVGSATVYNSIAGDVFGHKRHLSPLLDMSERSLELERTLNEERQKAEALLASEPNSANTSPRDGNHTGPSPRDVPSRMSSGTEYDPLPNSMRDSKLSPNMSAQLMMSPDLAQRVSAILNPANKSPDIPKLSFSDTHHINLSPKDRSPRLSQVREYDSARSESQSGSSKLSSDELDRHVTDVLSRSGGNLYVDPSIRSESRHAEQEADHSYLDKYMSPRYTSPRERSRAGSRAAPRSRPESRAYRSPRDAERRPESRSNLSPRQGSTSRSSSQSVDSFEEVNKKYMDRTSREVLEQAAKEYYTDLKKSKYDADDSVQGRTSQNRNHSMATTSDVSEELARLADKSHTPGSRPGSRCRPLEVVRHPDRTSSPRSQTGRSPPTRPARQPTAAVSEAETQSLVAKRLDRIEFMVLSALNEVPPQSRAGYPAAVDPVSDIPDTPEPDETIYGGDLRDAIKTTAPKSPLDSLPLYCVDEYTPAARGFSKDESTFNISISPVKRDPFTAFHRAHDLLSERLAQRANERTPGRRLSTRGNLRSPTRSSPTRDGPRPYPYPETRNDARARSRERTPSGLENIPEPRPLEIEEAGKSPSEEMLLSRHRKGRANSVTSIDESVTTIESTHTESDDAEPPSLPKEVMGSRKDPTEPSQGIYGTRSKSTCSKSPRVDADADSVGEVTPRQHDERKSAVGRAEKALQRGNQIRERLIAERNNRKVPDSRDKQRQKESSINPVELLNHRSPERRARRSRNQRPSHRSDERADNEEEERKHKSREPRKGGEIRPDLRGTSGPAYKDETLESSAPLDRTDYNKVVNMGDSLVLDFYTPPRPQHKAGRTRGKRGEVDSNPDISLPRGRTAWEDRPHSPDDEDSGLIERKQRLQRAADLRDESLERADRARQRSAERAAERRSSRSPPDRSISPRSNRSLSRSPPGDRDLSTFQATGQLMPRSPSPQERLHRERTEALLNPLERVDSPRSYHRTAPLVRPLECPTPEDPEERDMRSRLSQALSDRQMTYHILREELMKTEDEIKGRELNLAWQRISKRKPRPASVPLEESSSCADLTESSVVSSEFFDESRMNKLRNLLNNPLGHLVSKSKSKHSKPSKWENSERADLPREKRPTKPSNKKYDDLMKRIERQKESSETEDITGTTIQTTDDTVCSKCEQKRYAKKTAASKATVGQKPWRKPNKAKSESTITQDSSESEYKTSSTRPVTPTGVSTPHIHSDNQSAPLNITNNQHHKKSRKRLKDAGVMCPSPVKELHQKENTNPNRGKRSERDAHSRPKGNKESLAWYVGDEAKPKQNAFQKSRKLDSNPGGLVWYVPYTNPRPWTKTLPERKALSVSREPWVPDVQTATERKTFNDLCNAFNEATGRTKYEPTLQEAFRERNQRFVSCSRERQRRIKLRSDERQINKVHDEERAKLFDIQPSYKPSSRSIPERKFGGDAKRAIPKDEMYDRTSRVYKALPEVKNKEKMYSTQQERAANRLKAKLFNKKVLRHVLDHARVTHLVGKSKKPAHQRG